MQIVSRSVSPSAGVTITDDARTVTNQSPWGVVFDVTSGVNAFTFSYTLKGNLDYGEILVGVSDTDSSGACPGALCGESKIIRGPKCPATVGYCQASSNKADIVVMVDQSKFMNPSILSQTIPNSLVGFLDGLSTAQEKARFSMGSYYYANTGEKHVELTEIQDNVLHLLLVLSQMILHLFTEMFIDMQT